jgi:hypothetical protein
MMYKRGRVLEVVETGRAQEPAILEVAGGACAEIPEFRPLTPQSKAVADARQTQAQYRQLVISAPAGAVFNSRSRIFGTNIWW